jgi:preprotein translocase subunit SecG
MTVLPFLAVSFIMNVMAVLFVICCVALVLIILIQKGKGGGLSAAFGGSMASGILGSKTGDFLTWVTIVLVGIFLCLAVILAKYYKEGIGSYGESAPAPLSQTTNQTPTSPPVTDMGTAAGTSPVEGSTETPTEISIPAGQAPLNSAESEQETTEPAQDTTNTINEANVPNG